MNSNEIFLPDTAQAMLGNFEGTEGIELNMKINIRYYAPDAMLHTYSTNEGELIHFFEIDYVENLKEVMLMIEEMLNRKPHLLKVKKPLKNFEESGPYRAADIYKIPDDPDEILKYASPKGITTDHYFCFAFKGKDDDTVKLQEV